MKSDIKELAENQKFLKNQRKTEKLVGEREMPARDARWAHEENREKLRAMYAAYGLMRGKSFSVTENKYPEENHPLYGYEFQINKLLESYKFKK